MNTYSIALRVRRIVYEDAYISVPVTEAIMKPSADADGNVHLDTEALMAEGIRISKDARIEWRMESTTTDIHPIQQPMPEDRTSFMPDFT